MQNCQCRRINQVFEEAELQNCIGLKEQEGNKPLQAVRAPSPDCFRI
jgi:hypothetical protein